MEDDIEVYVRTCHVCQVDKNKCYIKTGLLQPLNVPEMSWLSVSIDFIYRFPKVDGKTSIVVLVDRLPKYSVIIAAPELCSFEVAADLF